MVPHVVAAAAVQARALGRSFPKELAGAPVQAPEDVRPAVYVHEHVADQQRRLQRGEVLLFGVEPVMDAPNPPTIQVVADGLTLAEGGVDKLAVADRRGGAEAD